MKDDKNNRAIVIAKEIADFFFDRFSTKFPQFLSNCWKVVKKNQLGLALTPARSARHLALSDMRNDCLITSKQTKVPNINFIFSTIGAPQKYF